MELYLSRIHKYIRGKYLGVWGIEGKSCTLTHFFAFEKHMADKATFNIKSVLQNRREVSFWRCCTARNSLHEDEQFLVHCTVLSTLREKLERRKKCCSGDSSLEKSMSVFFQCIKCYLTILIIATIHHVIPSSDIRSYQSVLAWIDPL